MARDILSAVLASVPANATAAKVMGKGVHYEPTLKMSPGQVSSDLPLPVLPLDSRIARKLIGKTFGRFTVLGYAGAGADGARWVVRCSCGRYEHRRAKVLRGPTDRLMCTHCDKTREYARRYREQGPRPLSDFAGKDLK